MSDLLYLRPLDLNSDEHIRFTYEIVEQRFKRTDINITEMSKPTFIQHVEYLKSDKIKYFYIGYCDTIPFFIIYINSKQYEMGFFFHAKRWKEVIFNYKEKIKKIIQLKTPNIPSSRKAIVFITTKFYYDLLGYHPELVDKTTAYIRSDNKLSQTVAVEANFFPKKTFYENEKPVYTYYEYNR